MNIRYEGENIEYSVIQSRRKTIAISIDPDQKILVKAPVQISHDEIQKIVEKKAGWIVKKRKELAKYQAQTEPQEQAGQWICQRAEHYNEELREPVNRICIKDQKSRWGSCSSKRNLNFNWRIIMAPPEVADYVVVHEMCHLRHLNHSPEFWKEVAGILPDYKERRKWLREHGSELMKKI